MPLDINGNIVNSSIVKTLNYKNVINRGLIFHMDAGAPDSYPESGIIVNDISSTTTNSDFATGWRQPSTFHIKGTLLNGGRVWSSEPEAQGGYSSVVLDRTFNANEDFEVVAYWARDYRGIAIIYGTNVSHFDFNGYSADTAGPYGGSLSTSGFPNGYSASHHGQYHSPIDGQGNLTTGYWFKWVRNGNNLSIQYSSSSKTGPWTNIKSNVTCSSTDRCCIIAGEASNTEVTDLTLEYIRSTKRNDTGTLVNGPTYSSSNGGSLIFDGTNDWLNLPTSLFAGSTSSIISTEFWVKFNATGNGSYWWSLADGTGGNPELRLQFASNNKLKYIWYDTSAYIIDSFSQATLTIGTWYHIASTTQNNEYKFYINGVLDSSFTGTTYNGGPSIVCHSIGTYNLSGTSPGYNGYTSMTLGSYKLYDRILTLSEISQNYNIQKNRFGL
jgi:hypothetical protein